MPRASAFASKGTSPPKRVTSSDNACVSRNTPRSHLGRRPWPRRHSSTSPDDVIRSNSDSVTQSISSRRMLSFNLPLRTAEAEPLPINSSRALSVAPGMKVVTVSLKFDVSNRIARLASPPSMTSFTGPLTVPEEAPKSTRKAASKSSSPNKVSEPSIESGVPL